MEKTEKKTDFDLSVLDYVELIDLHYKIEQFLNLIRLEEEKLKALEEGNSNE